MVRCCCSFSSRRSSGYGLTHIAPHVIRWRFTQETRLQSALGLEDIAPRHIMLFDLENEVQNAFDEVAGAMSGRPYLGQR